MRNQMAAELRNNTRLINSMVVVKTMGLADDDQVDAYYYKLIEIVKGEIVRHGQE